MREKIKEGVIVLKYKPTNEMIADGFTKVLDQNKHVGFHMDLHLER